MASMRFIGRAVLSAVVSSSLVLGVTPTVVLPLAAAETTSCDASFHGQENVESAACHTLRNKNELGTGDFTISPEKVAPGGVLTITGTNFQPRAQYPDAFLAIKLEDQTLQFDGNTDGTTKLELDSAGFYKVTGSQLPGKDGRFTVTVHIPADMKPGWSWIRVLGGQDSHGIFSKFKWFQVTDAPAAPAATATKAHVDRHGDAINIDASVANFDPNKAITAKINGKPASWKADQGKTSASIMTDAKGAAKGTLTAAAMSVPAGPDVTVELTDGTHTKTITTQVKPLVQINDPNITGRPTPALAIGDTGNLVVRGIPAGGTVTYVGANGVNFLHGDVTSAVITAQGKKGSYQTWSASSDGITIPDNPSLVTKKIEIRWTVNGTNYTADSGLYVAPKVAPFNPDLLEVRHADLPKGLYQTAYSAAHNQLFVTSADFGSHTSKLMVVNPKTLKVVKSIDLPGPKPESGPDKAPFGIAVDDTNNRIWVTSTIAGSVAVYDASTLKLIKEFPGSVEHPRSVVVDEASGIAYVSEPTSGKEELARFSVDKQLTPLATPGFAGAMNLRIDQSTGIITTASMTQPDALRVNVHDSPAEQKIFKLQPEMVSNASAADYDNKANVLFVGAQDTDNVSAVYTDQIGHFKWVTPVGADVLDVLYDARSNRIYTANRGAGTVSVLNPETGKIVANIAVGNFPNHLSTDGKGTIFVVNKSSQATGNDSDQIYAITPKIFVNNSTDDQTPAPGDVTPTPTPAPSQGSSDGSAFPIVAVLGVLAAVVSGAWWALMHGAIPTHLLPFPLAQLFKK